MKYQFNLTPAQLKLIVDALQAKSNEFNGFAQLMVQAAQAQEAALNAAPKTIEEVVETDEEITEVEEQETKNETE
jgi:hypothetical protein